MFLPWISDSSFDAVSVKRTHAPTHSLTHTHKVTVGAPASEQEETQRGLAVWFATYINSAEQKIEMEMRALNECCSHLPPDQS